MKHEFKETFLKYVILFYNDEKKVNTSTLFNSKSHSVIVLEKVLLSNNDFVLKILFVFLKQILFSEKGLLQER